jgi:hypothetical protein
MRGKGKHPRRARELSEARKNKCLHREGTPPTAARARGVLPAPLGPLRRAQRARVCVRAGVVRAGCKQSLGEHLSPQKAASPPLTRTVGSCWVCPREVCRWSGAVSRTGSEGGLEGRGGESTGERRGRNEEKKQTSEKRPGARRGSPQQSHGWGGCPSRC